MWPGGLSSILKCETALLGTCRSRTSHSFVAMLEKLHVHQASTMLTGQQYKFCHCDGPQTKVCVVYPFFMF